jgi:hypothetical protein
MLRAVLIVILMVLFFVQITTVDTRFLRKIAKRRFRNYDELMKVVCGENDIYCKRSL